MTDPDDRPGAPQPPSPEREYQDPHYHDDDEAVANDDAPPRPRLPGARRPPPRKLPRRHYED